MDLRRIIVAELICFKFVCEKERKRARSDPWKVEQFQFEFRQTMEEKKIGKMSKNGRMRGLDRLYGLSSEALRWLYQHCFLIFSFFYSLLAAGSSLTVILSSENKTLLFYRIMAY